MKRRISRSRLRNKGSKPTFDAIHKGGGWYEIYKWGKLVDKVHGKENLSKYNLSKGSR